MTWRGIMRDIIRYVERCLRHFGIRSVRIVKSRYSVKTHIRTYDTLRASPSQSPRMLKRRISHRLSTQYFKSTPLTLATQYQIRVVWRDGRKGVFYCGTLSQAVLRVEACLTIGTNTVFLQERLSPSYPHRAGSFLLFSERWPDVISTVSISRKTLPW